MYLTIIFSHYQIGLFHNSKFDLNWTLNSVFRESNDVKKTANKKVLDLVLNQV